MSKQGTKKSLAELQSQLDAARRVASLESHPGWTEICAQMDRKLETSKTRLCAMDCGPDETLEIRARLAEMGYLRLIVRKTADSIPAMEQELARRSETEKMRSQLDIPQARKDQIHEALQQGRTRRHQ